MSGKVLELLGGSSRSGLRLAAAALFNWRNAVAFLECRDDDMGEEFLLAMIVELDHDMLFVAGEHRAESELEVLNLGAVGESCSNSHLSV